ncbi:MAG TPA: hypothetical protein VFR15_10240 [Chloroflexia bacterium]|nr:hypothetical protein [Chloroflexia bacterium]
MDRSIEGEARQHVIPPRQLLVIGLAMVSLIAAMVYIGYETLGRNVSTGATRATAASPSRLASAPSQVNVGGEVTVRVTWQGPEAGSVFSVAMDTHSVDLDPYDLSTMATLHTNDGREAAAVRWDAPAGGHHRKGTLAFSEMALDGNPLVADDTQSIELVIYELSGVPARSFTWKLK